MIDLPHNKIKFATKPKAALIPFSQVRRGDLIAIDGSCNTLALFQVESTHIDQQGIGSMWENDKGHSVGIGVDEVTHIPADAQFVVFRKHLPAKKGATNG